MQWKYRFNTYSSSLDKQPPQVQPARFVEVHGADGRYDGVLRRFPGFSNYETQPGSLGRDPTGSDFDPDLCEYFEIHKELGSDVMYRGFIVGDRSTGSIEMWYKASDAADGTMSKKTWTQTYNSFGKLDLNAQSIAGSAVGGVFSGKSGGGPGGPPEVVAMAYGSVGGQPDALYVASNDLSHAGSRNIAIHSPGVSMFRGGVWSPLGTPPFGPTTGQITGLAIFQDKLWVSLDTKTNSIDGSGATAALWFWDGVAWYQYHDTTATGIKAIHVFASRLYLDDGTSTPYVDADLALQTGPTGLSTVLSAVDGFDSNSTNLIAFGQAQAGQIPIAFCTSSTNWATVHAGSGSSPPTGSRARAAKFTQDGTILHAFPTQGSSPYLQHLSRSATTLGSSAAWTQRAAETSNTSAYVSSVYFPAVATTAWLFGLFGSVWGTSTSGALQWSFVGSDTYTPITGLDGGSIVKGFSTADLTDELYVGGPFDFTTETTAFAMPVDGYFSIATRGPYIYLFMSNGNHKVIYYDTETSDFALEVLGPGATAMPPPKVVIGSAATGGNAVAGNHLYLQRFVDPVRRRFTALSPVDVEQIPMTADYQVPIIDTLGTDSCFDFSKFPRLDLYRTLSSGNAAVPAGGSLYRAARLGVGSDGDYTINMHLAPSQDRGDGDADVGLSDAQLPVDPDRLYNFTKEFVAELPEAYQAQTYQGTTFVLTPRDGFLDLRWSPTFREEPENFPPLNYFPTKIPVDAALSCRLVEVGDFLYLVGGTYIYRVQKSGAVIIVVEVHRGIPILHRNGMVRVGSRLYIATELGLLELDGRTGNLQDVPNTQRVFHDRWQGSLKAADATNSVRMGFDARLQCIFVLHPGLDECLCFWINTGKVTILPYCPYDNIVTGTDLNDQSTERAFFLTNRRWFATPNWDHGLTTPQTMTGAFIYSGQTLTPYNVTVTGATLGVGNTQVTVTAGGTGSNPFTYDGTNRSDITPMYATILTGTYAYQTVEVTGQEVNAIYFDGDFTGLVAGDIIALSPIVFGAIGSNLWNPRGESDTTTRKSIKSVGMTPARVRSLTLGSATPPGEASILRVGAMRHDDVIAYEPRSVGDPLVRPRSEASTTAGTALDIDQIHKNTVSLKHVDGPQLYPFILCYLSNLNLELHELTLTGDYYSKDRPGPGT